MNSLGERVRVGESTARIWRVGLGGAPIGGMYAPVPEAEAFATVRKAMDLGLRHIDTAPYYGMGRSEEVVGAALKGLKRGDYTLSTKVGRVLVPEGGAVGEEWAESRGLRAVFDFSEEGVRKSVEGSRGRLGVRDFDILFIHDCDGREAEALGHTYPVLERMREHGEVRAVGAGLNSYETALKLARAERFDCFLVAGRYTLLEQGALDEFFPYCKDKKIGVVLGGVFNSGILASGASPGSRYNYSSAPREILAKTGKVKEVCDRFGVSLRSAALQFVLANPDVTSIVVGCRSSSEVEENAAALQQEVPRGLWEGLKAERLLREDAPTP
ncbi:MAG: aldo/keto reductase [Nitrososphaerota archaeon]|nr:aldo/keto reductase [Nitrososphaerota archaeon]